jgi:excisionase family DNA binding protein
MNDLRDALTVKETAQRLGVSHRYVMQLIAEGKLEGSFILGHMRFIPRSAVERWAQKRQGNGTR